MLHPDGELGSEFWQRIQKKAQERFGTNEIPTNTFNKIWIIPQEAIASVGKQERDTDFGVELQKIDHTPFLVELAVLTLA